MLKRFAIFILFCSAAFAYFPSITSFNAGQVSPLMEARADFQKYRASSRTIENMFVTVQGPVLKRPGTKYIATVKTGVARVLSFEYSTDDAYVIEAGNLYMRFYRNGGQILDDSDDPVEITTVFATDELFDIQYVQTDNDMYFANGSDPPQILTRADHDDWTIGDVDFTNGPFLRENETTTTITPTSYGFAADASAETFTITGSGDLSSIFTDGKEFLVNGSTANDGTWTVSSTNATDPFVITITTDITSGVNDGTILIVGGTVTLTASAAIFQTTSGATHVGSIWAVKQVRGNSVLEGSFSANGTSLSSSFFTGSYGFTTSGNSDGTITLQRSTNNGISWRAALSASTNVDFDNLAETEDDGAIYRIVMSNYGSGTPTFTFTITDDTNKGVVEITALTSTTVATGTIIVNLVTTDSTTTWREPYWSDYRGWPKTVAFHQQRLVFGGSDTYPQTIWFGKQDPDDYANFLEGTLDTSAFTAALEGQNPLRWLLSQDFLLLGTSGSCGKWGEQGKSVAPTSPFYQEQTRYGSAALQAVLAGDSVLYIERGVRRVRGFGFDIQVEKYLSPDLTILTPEITDSGIVDIAFQLRPNPILWCVLADGEIATMTFQTDQAVIAWTKQITDGDFESVTVISSGADEDEVWVSVERTVDGTTSRYIEQFQPNDWGDQEDAWFVDSGLGYDSTADTDFSGLDHLEGETVAVWADGIVLESERVLSGEITIDVSSSRVIAGLPFTAKLETLPLRIDPQDATLNKHIKRLWIDVIETGPYSFGNGPDGDLTEVVSFGGATVTALEPFHTSTVKLQQFPFVYGGRIKQTVFIQSSKPVPLGIRSIEADVEIRR